MDSEVFNRSPENESMVRQCRQLLSVMVNKIPAKDSKWVRILTNIGECDTLIAMYAKFRSVLFSARRTFSNTKTTHNSMEDPHLNMLKHHHHSALLERSLSTASTSTSVSPPQSPSAAMTAAAETMTSFAAAAAASARLFSKDPPPPPRSVYHGLLPSSSSSSRTLPTSSPDDDMSSHMMVNNHPIDPIRAERLQHQRDEQIRSIMMLKQQQEQKSKKEDHGKVCDPLSSSSGGESIPSHVSQPADSSIPKFTFGLNYEDPDEVNEEDVIEGPSFQRSQKEEKDVYLKLIGGKRKKKKKKKKDILEDQLREIQHIRQNNQLDQELLLHSQHLERLRQEYQQQHQLHFQRQLEQQNQYSHIPSQYVMSGQLQHLNPQQLSGLNLMYSSTALTPSQVASLYEGDISLSHINQRPSLGYPAVGGNMMMDTLLQQRSSWDEAVADGQRLTAYQPYPYQYPLSLSGASSKLGGPSSLSSNSSSSGQQSKFPSATTPASLPSHHGAGPDALELSMMGNGSFKQGWQQNHHHR
jgi:hypothetical protein